MPEEEGKDVKAPEVSEGAKTVETAKKPSGRSQRQPRKAWPSQSAERIEGELTEHVIKINRVSKVVKGGKNFSFSALVVAGDGHGKVGIGFGKSNEISDAIRKGTMEAKSSFININLKGDTIPHEIIGRFKASRVLMKPAGPGTGVIAGGPVRALCDAAGIKNVLTKSLGSRNAINVARATLIGFENLRLKRIGESEDNDTKDKV